MNARTGRRTGFNAYATGVSGADARDDAREPERDPKACSAYGCELPGTVSNSTSHPDTASVQWWCGAHFNAEGDIQEITRRVRAMAWALRLLRDAERMAHTVHRQGHVAVMADWATPASRECAAHGRADLAPTDEERLRVGRWAWRVRMTVMNEATGAARRPPPPAEAPVATKPVPTPKRAADVAASLAAALLNDTEEL